MPIIGQQCLLLSTKAESEVQVFSAGIYLKSRQKRCESVTLGYNAQNQLRLLFKYEEIPEASRPLGRTCTSSSWCSRSVDGAIKYFSRHLVVISRELPQSTTPASSSRTSL